MGVVVEIRPGVVSVDGGLQVDGLSRDTQRGRAATPYLSEIKDEGSRMVPSELLTVSSEP